MSTRPWLGQAGCRESDPELFYSSDPTDQLEARRTCAGCPVRVECLQDALEHNSPKADHGIWGGTGPRQRLRLRHGGVGDGAKVEPASACDDGTTPTGLRPPAVGASSRQPMVAVHRQPDGIHTDAAGRVNIFDVNTTPRWVVLVDDRVVARCGTLDDARAAAWTARDQREPVAA